MSASTFTTQRQLMMKNMPASALDNPFAKQQKMLLYLMPIFFAISGVNFPIGVLLYWLTTNVWSMCQQFYVIRNMPAPGSLAEKAMQERRRKKGKTVEEFTVKGLDKGEPAADEAPKPTGGQRVQPSRNKKKKGGTTGGRRQEAGTRQAHERPQATDRQLRVTTMTEQDNTVVDDTTAAEQSTETGEQPTSPAPGATGSSEPGADTSADTSDCRHQCRRRLGRSPRPCDRLRRRGGRSGR